MSRSRNDEKDKAEGLHESHARLSRMMRQGRSFSGRERNCVFLNTGPDPGAGGRFATVSAVSGLDFPDDGRAVSMVDWDRDGDLDMWIANRNAPRLRLMRNNAAGNNPGENHFAAFKLVGNGKNTSRDAVGARVEVIAPDQGAARLVKTMRAGGSFLAQSGKWLHFGLGKTESIERVLVHWPGGEKEVFTGARVNGFNTLVQGSGEIAVGPGPGPGPTLAASDQTPLTPPEGVRIPLMTPLPKPVVAHADFDGAPREARTGLGVPLLVTLWASWCDHCRAELTAFTARERDIRAAGIDLLALSVDGLGDDRSSIENARKLLTDLKFPFPAGRATRALIQDFQRLHDLVIPLERPLPVPASFLIDADGRLVVIYKGTARVEDVLADAGLTPASYADRMEHAAPFPGRSMRRPGVERTHLEGSAVALFYMGSVMQDAGRLEEAARFYGEVLAIRPDSYKASYNLGVVYAARGLLTDALPRLHRAAAQAPDRAEAHKVLGRIYMNGGSLQRAASHYTHALGVDSRDGESLTNLGGIYWKGGLPDRAEELFKRAIALQPANLQARHNLGAVLLSRGEADQAAEQFEQILDHDPQYPDANYNLGVIHERRGNSARAARRYTDEIRVNPKSARAFTNLGALYERQGEVETAVSLYQQALQANPDYDLARKNLERLQADKKKNQKEGG
ncbi:MAG: tetratricopeptide repeat protein [Desulfobacterales bacterium]|nr:tetratricopeptide repeat protein [Desulfobacterales bacterium]